MAIFKCFGLEIRTGKDQSHFQPQHPPRVPEPISYEKEQERLAIASNTMGNHMSGQNIVPAEEDHEPNNPKRRFLSIIGGGTISRKLSGVKVMEPRITRRMALAREMIYPSMRDVVDVWKLSQYESQVLKAKEMLEEGRFFSICPVDELRKLCKLQHYDKDIYRFLNSKHCDDWVDMNDADIKMVFLALMHIFSDGRIGVNGETIDGNVGTKVTVFDV